MISREESSEDSFIKRVIALEDGEIDFEQEIVFVNGQLISESYIKEPARLKGDMSFPQTVLKGRVLF